MRMKKLDSSLLGKLVRGDKLVRNGALLCPSKVVSLKNKLDTYKLLKRGRSRVLLVSMATMLGTSELMTEDLNEKQKSEVQQ